MDFRAQVLLPSLLRLSFPSSLYVFWKNMAVFHSILSFTDEEISLAPDLEPASENLLRTLNVEEALITAPRINMINDRETFVGFEDTEAGFKNNHSRPRYRSGQWRSGPQARDVETHLGMEASPHCF